MATMKHETWYFGKKLLNCEEPTTYLPQKTSTLKFLSLQVNGNELRTDAELWNDKQFN